ncbi:cytochrome P450 81Q32 isoform X3 [Daucus carota subsp. sativus]|uniref:cytochrome P450 81Q32 isoform X3 n=1 Tax=Daucus carota subsp. sativus TaxID=79200 RepID=UPI0007F03B5C|nr:PREDICTED: isoflavone 3'-hydroxylase-like isoform X3 [Daucus carota subsp. sativus]
MEQITLFHAFISLLLIIFVSKLFRTSMNLPPSPFPKLPIIGHLHLIKSPLHRSLDTLSKAFGPVMSLQFGSSLVVVVSSPAAVEECFTKNDIVLANRPRMTMGKYMAYNWSTMAGASYGDHWRNLRRIASLEIFSTSRLNSFLSIRRDEVNHLLLALSQNAGQGFKKVVLKPNLNVLSFNIVMRMIAGKRYFGEVVDDQEKAKQVRRIIEEVLSVVSSYPGDFLPFLKWIDYKNYEKRAAVLSKEMDGILQGVIEEHRNGESRNSMVGHLLSLQKSQPDSYSDFIIKGLMVVLIFAGSDTSGVTIEWAMSLLLNHPHVLKKARDEIDIVIGQDRLVEESDLSKLPYLHNIILESFRLFPATPLLLPHKASADCKVSGYDIPAGTLVLVNSWSIHRDPKVWDDPTSFKPERFEGIEVETHKLMPFGMGRRSCPGSGLAHRVVGLVLASLIQCFEWERVSDELIDLAEGKGLTMPKAEPLEAMCKTRNVLDTINT